MGRKRGLFVPGYGNLRGAEEKKMRELLRQYWPAVEQGLMSPQEAWEKIEEEFNFWQAARQWLKGKKKRR